MSEHTPELALRTAADPDLVAMMTDLFAAYRSSRPAPTQATDFDPTLWARLDELGLTRLTAAEDRGGSGGSWVEGAALLGLAAGAAAPVPLAENDLADWLLGSAGLPHDGTLRTVCRPGPSGVADAVTFGRDAASLVALWQDTQGWRVADVPAARATVTHRRNVAGEPSDRVEFELSDLRAGTPVDDEVGFRLHQRGALARSAQVCGGMERVLELVLTHVREREQFGRPIGRFQAVQVLVADIATETSLARAATDTAVALAAASGWQDPGLPFAVAVAKSCVGHASSTVVRNAHQVLGAIGTTLEHELHLVTRPILARRSDYGSVHEWDEALAALAVAAGTDRLWSLITQGPASGQS